MAKIIFTHSYFYKYDSKQWEAKQPYPPYGTIIAAALMRERGHEVLLWDANLQDSPQPLQLLLQKEKPQYLIIYDDGFNYLTKMCLTNMREACFEMCRYGKELGCKVIVSSSDSTDHYEKYLQAGADFVLLGEAEQTLDELIENLEKDIDIENIQGLAYLKADKAICTPKRPVLRNLDELPQPAWDLIDTKAYKEIWLEHHGYFMLNIATTRGCPYKCNWCAKPIYGNRYNTRSPQRVADELEMLMTQFGATYFWVCDDIFGLKPRWVQEFRDILQQKNIKPQLKIQSRVDLLLQEDNIQALAEAGLKEVWVGAESGSQKILDAMDKGTKVEEIYEATRLLKAKGIRVAFFLQFGYLGETKEDIAKTINMVTDLLPDNIGISVSYPLPNTKFYEVVKSQMVQKQNWEDSDDLAMMYEATYPPAYYKRLHRYVHRVYRQAKYQQQMKSQKSPKAFLGFGYNKLMSHIEALRLKKLETV